MGSGAASQTTAHSLLIGVVALIVVAIVCVRLRIENQQLSTKAKKFDEHCHRLRFMLGADSRDLQRPLLRENAAHRFEFTDIEDIHRCATTSVDLHDVELCWIFQKYDCLSDLAKQAELSNPTRPRLISPQP